MLSRPVLKLLKLPRHRFGSMLEQLVFEEKLFRQTRDNWCLLSYGKPAPAVVMGISGKPEKLLDVEKCRRHNLDVVRRFSGGGTVVVDHNSVFVSFVCEKTVLPRKVANSPPELMKWSAGFYDSVFRRCRSLDMRRENDGGGGHEQALKTPPPQEQTEFDRETEFRLQQHDYCFGKRKFGGNAESITKDRWVHHTSFLWDFEDANMEFLQLPEKRPEYREDRGHLEFLCKLKDYVPTARAQATLSPPPPSPDEEGQETDPGVEGSHPSDFFTEAVVATAARSFEVVEVTMAEVEALLDETPESRRRSTKLVDLDEHV